MAAGAPRPVVRAPSVADRAAIRAVVTAAFAPSTAEADLVEALRAADDVSVELIAVDRDDSVIGHIVLSRLRRPAGCLALAPLCVRPDRQRRGVGGSLVTAALAAARADGRAAAFVLGDPAYYRRFGFSVATAAPFETAYPKEYLQALELHPGSLDSVGGPLIYPAAFSAFE